MKCKTSILAALWCIGTVSVAAPGFNSTNQPIIPINMPDEKPIYSEVVDCGSVSLLDVFRRARLWILQSASDDKLLLNDKETGDLVNNATLNLTLPRSEGFSGGVFTVKFVLTVECANRKYRSTISHIEVLQGGTDKSVPLESFRLQDEAATKHFRTELESRLKLKMEDLKLHVKDYKSF